MALPGPTRTDDVVHAPYIRSTEASVELTPHVKVSLTASASTRVAALSTTIFRCISRALSRPLAMILQNNMVQTIGSAGESISAGVPEERDGPRADSGQGVLIASGLIACSATGIVLAALQPKGLDAAFDLSLVAGSSRASLATMTYVALLAIPVYAVARPRRSP